MLGASALGVLGMEIVEFAFGGLASGAVLGTPCACFVAR